MGMSHVSAEKVRKERGEVMSLGMIPLSNIPN